MRADDRLGNLNKLASVLLGMGSEECKGLVCVDPVSGHEDALCLFDDGASSECALQVAELGEASERDVERILQLVVAVEDHVGEDAAFGCFVDLAWVVSVEECDDWAGCFVDDRGDQLERVLAVKPEADERDFCMRLTAEWSNILDLE